MQPELTDLLNEILDRIEPARDYLTPLQCAELIGITTRTLRVWHSRGEGPPRLAPLPGGAVRYARDQVDEWMRSDARHALRRVS